MSDDCLERIRQLDDLRMAEISELTHKLRTAERIVCRLADRWMIERRRDGALYWGGEFHADEGPRLTDAELAFLRPATGEDHYETWEP